MVVDTKFYVSLRVSGHRYEFLAAQKVTVRQLLQGDMRRNVSKQWLDLVIMANGGPRHDPS
jgi:hypothetical protein